MMAPIREPDIPFLVLDLGLDIIDRIRGFNLEPPYISLITQNRAPSGGWQPTSSVMVFPCKSTTVSIKGKRCEEWKAMTDSQSLDKDLHSTTETED